MGYSQRSMDILLQKHVPVTGIENIEPPLNMSEENLKKRTIKGFGWNFLDNILNRGISFVVGIVLARLLSPSEYGLIGIIMIFIAIFNSIVESLTTTDTFYDIFEDFYVC